MPYSVVACWPVAPTPPTIAVDPDGHIVAEGDVTLKTRYFWRLRNHALMSEEATDINKVGSRPKKVHRLGMAERVGVAREAERGLDGFTAKDAVCPAIMGQTALNYCGSQELVRGINSNTAPSRQASV